MGLSEYERTVLRRLDADLDRQDPRLRRRLTEFTAQERADAAVSWRPPRVAVVMAAVLLAGAGFMAAAVTMLMRQPCRVAADTRVTSGPLAHSRHPAPVRRHATSSPQDTGSRPAAPGHARSSSPAAC